MTGRRSTAIQIVGVIGMLLGGATLLAQDRLPTPEEEVAGYRQNLARLPAPRITIERVLRPSEELRKFWTDEVAKLEPALKDPSRSPKQRESAQAMLEQARAALEGMTAEAPRREDFWSDRASWQLRVPFRDFSAQPRAASDFPSDPLTAEALGNTYRRYRIYTYAPAQQPAMSVWYGIPNPGAPPFGRRSDKILEELPLDFQLPPLGAIAGPTAFLAHPLDVIFVRPGGTLKVLGPEKLGEASVLRVEHTWLQPSREPHRTAGQLMTGDAITAWLDPRQGYLPLRAEWRRQWQFNGKPLNVGRPYLHQVVRTTKVKRLDGGGFYPSDGVIELRSPRPDVPPYPDIDRMIAGEPFHPPMLAENQIAWRVIRVEPNAANREEIFRPDFPPETEWFRESTAEELPVEPLKVGQPAPALHVTRWTDQKQRTLADLRGRVVVLYFWMAWQEPCMAPLGVLEDVQRKYGARGVTVLGIHVGNVELDELLYAAGAAGVTFPNALDAGTQQTSASTLGSYHVRLYPTTFVIDRIGRIAWTSDDARNAELNARAARSLNIKLPTAQQRGQGIGAQDSLRIFAAVLGEQVERALGQQPAKRAVPP